MMATSSTRETSPSLSLDLPAHIEHRCDNARIFKVDDFDFTGYNARMLRILHTNRFLLRTRFPKVAVMLLNIDQLKKWHTERNERRSSLADVIVDSIRQYAFNYQGNIVKQSIDLNDHAFWRIIVSNVLSPNTKTSNRLLHRRTPDRMTPRDVSQCMHRSGFDSTDDTCDGSSLFSADAEAAKTDDATADIDGADASTRAAATHDTVNAHVKTGVASHHREHATPRSLHAPQLLNTRKATRTKGSLSQKNRHDRQMRRSGAEPLPQW